MCEGVPDALALQANRRHAVGVPGAAAFREEWVDHFLKFDVVLAPDGDSGGEAFKTKVSQFFRARGKPLSILRIPHGRDVAATVAEIQRKQ